MTELTDRKDYINGEANPLGLPNDLMVLFQSVIPGTSESFHSFDFLKDYLLNNSAGGPLAIALNDWNQAKVDYANFKNRQDQLAEQLRRCRNLYDERLRQIVGVPFGHPDYDKGVDNEGGELALQELNIKLALNRQEATQKDAEKLQSLITSEIELLGQQAGINDAMRKIVLKFGDQGVSIEQRIAAISSDQVFFQTGGSKRDSFR